MKRAFFSVLTRLLGRETGLKAEQTPATLTPLIALRTWSLEGLLCIRVRVCVCVCVCVCVGLAVWCVYVCEHEH